MAKMSIPKASQLWFGFEKVWKYCLCRKWSFEVIFNTNWNFYVCQGLSFAFRYKNYTVVVANDWYWHKILSSNLLLVLSKEIHIIIIMSQNVVIYGHSQQRTLISLTKLESAPSQVLDPISQTKNSRVTFRFGYRLLQLKLFIFQ